MTTDTQAETEMFRQESSGRKLRPDTFEFTRAELEEALGIKLPVSALSSAIARVMPDYEGSSHASHVHHQEFRDNGDIMTYRGIPEIKAPKIPPRREHSQHIQYVRISTGPVFQKRNLFQVGEEEHSFPQSDLEISLGLHTVKSLHEKARRFNHGTPPHVETTDAVKILMDISDRQHMPVRVWAGGLAMMGLGLTGPETKEQAIEALHVIGDAAHRIKEGETVSFEQLGEDLQARAGLKPIPLTGINAALSDASRGINRRETSLDAALDV